MLVLNVQEEKAIATNHCKRQFVYQQLCALLRYNAGRDGDADLKDARNDHDEEHDAHTF